jgi:phosphoglycolate phosphatase
LHLKAIIFDKDGTLFDIQRSWSDWCQTFIFKFCKKNNLNNADLAKALDFDTRSKQFKNKSIFVHGSIDEVIDKVDSVFPSIGKKNIHFSLFEDIGDAKQVPLTNFENLFYSLQKFKIGLITNDSEKNARQHLDQHNITKYFHKIFGYDSGYGAKPDSGQLEAFCNQMRIEPHEVIMIGDSTYDLIAARKINMNSIGVLSGTALRGELIQYTPHLLDSIEHLIDWLKRMEGKR